jgi:hypothetical protein
MIFLVGYGAVVVACFVAAVAVPSNGLRVFFGLSTVAMIVVPIAVLAYALSHMQMTF